MNRTTEHNGAPPRKKCIVPARVRQGKRIVPARQSNRFGRDTFALENGSTRITYDTLTRNILEIADRPTEIALASLTFAKSAGNGRKGKLRGKPEVTLVRGKSRTPAPFGLFLFYRNYDSKHFDCVLYPTIIEISKHV